MGRMMLKTRRTLVRAVVAVTALAMFGVSPAHGSPSDSKGEPGRGAVAGQVDESLAPDYGAQAKVAASPAAKAALAAIQAQIARHVDTHGTAYTFASYLDATTGKIVLSTDAPATLVATLTALPGASVAERQAAGQAEVRRSTARDLFHRRDDIAPFWGGAGLLAGGLCSSGYAVRNGAGTVFATTAGHCYANGTNVLVESGARTYGIVSNRNLPTFNNQPRDVELLGGQSYAGRIYTGPACCPTSSVPVFAAGEAFVGFANYCHSGRTTGENCGHTATSITGQVCTGTGCKSPVIVFNGGVQPQGGDSGSPFYVMDNSGRAWIRGHVIAGDGVTSFAEKWTEVSALLSVSIVTG